MTPTSPHSGFVLTGEHRPPQPGDWFLAEPKRGAILLAGPEGSYGPTDARWIARKVDE